MPSRNARTALISYRVCMHVQNAFKIVYVAPMKALAAEVTAAFSHRLAPLGVSISLIMSKRL